MSNKEWILNCLGRLSMENGFKVSRISEEGDFYVLGVENVLEFWKQPLKIVCKMKTPEDIKEGDLVIWYNGHFPQRVVRITGLEEKVKFPKDEIFTYGFYSETLTEENKIFIHFGIYEKNFEFVVCMEETEKLFEKEMNAKNG